MDSIFKTGLVVCTYNRKEYLTKTFDSLLFSKLPKELCLVIVDDCSDKEIISLINDYSEKFQSKGIVPTLITKQKRAGVCDSLILGFDFLVKQGCEILINIDSDALVRNDFIDVLTKLKIEHPNNIVTGFHSKTKNKDGSERHIITEEYKDYCIKKSVGGINFCIDQNIYSSIVRPVLIDCLLNGGNWDHKSCIKAGYKIVCSVPSIIQHIGFDSAMNHNEEPDTAQDFKELHLPNITLIGVDCVNVKRLEEAVNKSCENILFGSVKILSSQQIDSDFFIKIPHISSIEKYSEFIIRNLSDYVDTDYCLVIQHDGYVLNHRSWTDDFLNHDYIGATWWYKDGMNVGNGGFSLRSKKLLELTKSDKTIKQLHPEDHHICRTYRPYLESKGISFAPEVLAKRFSIEGHGGQEKKYNGQFGYHGVVVEFFEEKKKNETLIINQFQGLGDIIFSMKVINDLIKEGHKIIWPVNKEYVSIQKHFPNVTFIDKSILNIEYNKNQEYYIGEHIKVIPLRFADSICKVEYKDCMKSKYLYFNKDWKVWKNIEIVRDFESENMLFEKVLKENGIKKGEKYNLINSNFRTDLSGKVSIATNNGYKNIIMNPIKGYTMIDWSMVIENATNIHTVGTSINYLIELLNTKAKAIHLYVRHPDEVDFRNYEYILSKHKPYIFMEPKIKITR